MASLVEFTLHKNKGLGATCKPSGLCPICRQCVTEEVVEVERSLVDQRVGLCRWILFELHDFGAGCSHRLFSPRAEIGRAVTTLF